MGLLRRKLDPSKHFSQHKTTYKNVLGLRLRPTRDTKDHRHCLSGVSLHTLSLLNNIKYSFFNRMHPFTCQWSQTEYTYPSTQTRKCIQFEFIKYSIPTRKKAQRVNITTIDQLIMFGEIIAVYSETHIKPINITNSVVIIHNYCMLKVSDT